MTGQAALIDPIKRIGTVTRVSASHVEMTLPEALAAAGRRGLAKGAVGDFVFVDCDRDVVLGRITEVGIPEKQQSSLEHQLEHDAVVEPQGRLQLLATVSKTSQKVSRGINTQPRVGDGVFLADGHALSMAIEDALKGDIKRNGGPLMVNLGRLSGVDGAEISIPPEKLFGRHCGVFGATGGGKSWTVSRLVNEVVRLGGKCILFDPTGEFTGKIDTASHFSFSKLSQRQVDSGVKQIHFPYRRLSEADLYALLTPSPQSQGPNLRSAFKSLRLAQALKNDKKYDAIEDAERGIVRYDVSGKGFIEVRTSGVVRKAGQSRHALSVAQIELREKVSSDLCDFDISVLSDQIKEECVKQFTDDTLGNYGKYDDFSLGSCNSLNVRIETYLSSSELSCLFGEQGQSVVNVIKTFLNDPEARALVISFEHVSYKYNTRGLLLNAVGRHLLHLARDEKFTKTPLICFLDEAHQFIGGTLGVDQNAVALDAFGLIAKEGRKYGLTTVIATQRPRDIPEDVLSQLGTLFVHRLTNGRDRETIERACGDLDRSAAAFIPSLSQGEAIVVGPDLPAPLPIMMTQPEKGQRPESHGPRYQESWGQR